MISDLYLGNSAGVLIVSRNKLQDRIRLANVETKHAEQFNNLLRYVFQVTNRDLQIFGWENREITQAKLPVLKYADVVGWFDGDKLISQLAVYPFQVNIFGRIYEMGGLTGVGTYPEYANLGLMNKLMLHALTKMRAASNQFLIYFRILFRIIGGKAGRSLPIKSHLKFRIPSCRKLKKFLETWNG